MVSREFVLKNFNKKLLEARKQRAKEIKLTLQEIEDLGYIIFEIMSELTDKKLSEKAENKIDQSDDSELSISGGSFKDL